MTAPLSMHEVRLAYPQNGRLRTVVEDFSLQLEAGQIGCLLGPSGCGKTTVLRAIAGFEPLQNGRIALGDVLLSGPGRHLPPEQRRVGLVFQEHALFPHLSAAQNVGFGLRRRPAAERAARVAQMLDLVGLHDLGPHLPHELSGGQQQRIALARALAPQPDLLLLDEPFSNLDGSTRERLSRDVRAILKAAGQTAILVTHHENEAHSMADQLGVMHAGRLSQWTANQPAG